MALAALPALILAGCAALTPTSKGDRPAVVADPAAQGPTRIGFGSWSWRGAQLDLEWHGPRDAAPTQRAPTGVLLQHGFGRSCANLRGTARRIAAQGVVTLCVNADMARGAPELAAALARELLAARAAQHGGPSRTSDFAAPWPVPERWVLAGHSAGAAFAAQVAAAMAQTAADDGARRAVAGLLLLDPVDGPGFAQALLSVSDAGRRPVWAMLAAPSRCNARQSALPALSEVVLRARAVGRYAQVGWQWRGSATHLDAEGEDTEAVAVWACGEGWPRPASTEALRRLVVQAMRAMAPARGDQPISSESVAADLQRQGLVLPLP